MRAVSQTRGIANRYVVVSVLWCAAALAIKPFFAYVDFGAFYSMAIEKILAGMPLDLYAFVFRPPHSDLVLPVTNPPIWFFYLAPWYAAGKALGISDFNVQTGLSYGQAFVLAVTLPLDILLCRTVVRLAEVRTTFTEPGRWHLFLCLLLSPLLWLSSIRFGHNESAMVLLVLLAIAAGERGRPWLSGVLWGLAFGIKTTAVVPALVYFGWGLGRERRRAMAIAVGVSAVVFAGPLLPYLLLRREQVVYALVGFEKLRPVGGYVLWKLLPDPLAAATYANVLILAFSASVGLAMARRRGNSFLAGGGAWALVLGQVFLLLFGKALFIWYPLAASCFLYLAFMYGRKKDVSIPLVPLVLSLFLWIVQGGGWVGETVNAVVKLRSAIWVVLLLAIAAMAIKGLRDPAAREAPQP
jgi:hypothetical protein